MTMAMMAIMVTMMMTMMHDDDGNDGDGDDDKCVVFNTSCVANFPSERMLTFGSAKVPKLSKANLVNTEVHLLIQYIHRLLSQEAFDDSVMGDSIPQSHHDPLDY